MALHQWRSLPAAGSGCAATARGDQPVESSELIALCAPRLVVMSYGIPERGDAKWLDHQGSYVATAAAQPVFQLLGARALGASSTYRLAKMPPVNTGLLAGALAWRQRDRGHTDGPNVRFSLPGRIGSWAETLLTEHMAGRGGGAQPYKRRTPKRPRR